MSGSFCVLQKPEWVGAALYESTYLCVCGSLPRSSSLPNDERPWGIRPGVRGAEGAGELHYLLIATPAPLWLSQASVHPPVSWQGGDREFSWGLVVSTIWPGCYWRR